MTTFYHGSYTEVKAPRVNAGRRNLDFGRGFYVTTHLRFTKSYIIKDEE